MGEYETVVDRFHILLITMGNEGSFGLLAVKLFKQIHCSLRICFMTPCIV